MKLVNYQLQTQIECLSDLKSSKFFKEYLQTILTEKSKPYYQRADYIGLSLHETKSKIDCLSKDIIELQNLKKKLINALEIAKELTAQIFEENGIDRIDGNKVSSLTLTKASSKEKNIISVKDEQKVMSLGYVCFSVDLKGVEDAIKTEKGLDELKDLIDVTKLTVSTPAKIKVNSKKASANNETDEILIIEEKSEMVA
ncbi:hypothetical protein [Arcobacter peruensis]|uniref:hypothetical protein n=1 Tax=Arcobacter peruensis TaxID=2320140 RepID=UPI000F085B3E|nr:hypothetical protein [Arcobacter peruensis]